MTPPQTEIEEVIRKINNAWQKGPLDDLNDFFHHNMIIAGPDFQILGKGREACIKSYKDFGAAAVIHSCTEGTPEIHVQGDTAVAGYHFDIDYEIQGRRCHETGRDLFVFTRENGRWLAVWRTMIVDTAE